MASTVGGANNPRWMAPELLTDAQATAAADVFAFGVVMWELLTWDIPWQTEQAFMVGGGGQEDPGMRARGVLQGLNARQPAIKVPWPCSCGAAPFAVLLRSHLTWPERPLSNLCRRSGLL
jgi:hypothetical protein